MMKKPPLPIRPPCPSCAAAMAGHPRQPYDPSHMRTNERIRSPRGTRRTGDENGGEVLMKTIDLSGRVALVVGGGGGGIGTAVAVALAEAGADVGTITAVADHADDTVKRVEALGRKATGVVADVTRDDELVAAIATVAAEL